MCRREREREREREKLGVLRPVNHCGYIRVNSERERERARVNHQPHTQQRASSATLSHSLLSPTECSIYSLSPFWITSRVPLRRPVLLAAIRPTCNTKSNVISMVFSTHSTELVQHSCLDGGGGGSFCSDKSFQSELCIKCNFTSQNCLHQI